MHLESPILVEDRIVSCDGGTGALGHPAVYLHIGNENEIVCPYCSRHFVLAEHAEEEPAH
jgi:uncharacterized Zn-finger protein